MLMGTLADNVFRVTVLLVPKQKVRLAPVVPILSHRHLAQGTSDTCETVDEEAIFTFQDSRDVTTLAWIHTVRSSPFACAGLPG